MLFYCFLFKEKKVRLVFYKSNFDLVDQEEEKRGEENKRGEMRDER